MNLSHSLLRLSLGAVFSALVTLPSFAAGHHFGATGLMQGVPGSRPGSTSAPAIPRNPLEAVLNLGLADGRTRTYSAGVTWNFDGPPERQNLMFNLQGITLVGVRLDGSWALTRQDTNPKKRGAGQLFATVGGMLWANIVGNEPDKDSKTE